MSEELTPENITAKLAEKGITKQESKSEEKEEAVSMPEKEEVLGEAVEETVELTEVEQEAAAKGWKPEGEKSAEEFLRAEPLYEEIKMRGKEIKALKSQMDELMNHVSGLKKAGYQERMEAIKAEREDAVIRSDIDSVNYYDEELSNLQSEMQKDIQKTTVHPAAQQFVDKHKDLFSDFSLEAMEIKRFLNDRDVELASYNLDPELHIKTLEKDLVTKYPNKFSVKEPEQQESKPKVQAVESDTRPIASRKKSKFTFSDLTHDQKQIYKYMERRGVMAGEDYIKQLIEIGELK